MTCKNGHKMFRDESGCFPDECPNCNLVSKRPVTVGSIERPTCSMCGQREADYDYGWCARCAREWGD